MYYTDDHMITEYETDITTKIILGVNTLDI